LHKSPHTYNTSTHIYTVQQIPHTYNTSTHIYTVQQIHTYNKYVDKPI